MKRMKGGDEVRLRPGSPIYWTQISTLLQQHLSSDTTRIVINYANDQHGGLLWKRRTYQQPPDFVLQGPILNNNIIFIANTECIVIHTPQTVQCWDMMTYRLIKEWNIGTDNISLFGTIDDTNIIAFISQMDQYMLLKLDSDEVNKVRFRPAPVTRTSCRMMGTRLVEIIEASDMSTTRIIVSECKDVISENKIQAIDAFQVDFPICCLNRKAPRPNDILFIAGDENNFGIVRYEVGSGKLEPILPLRALKMLPLTPFLCEQANHIYFLGVSKLGLVTLEGSTKVLKSPDDGRPLMKFCHLGGYLFALRWSGGRVEIADLDIGEHIVLLNQQRIAYKNLEALQDGRLVCISSQCIHIFDPYM